MTAYQIEALSRRLTGRPVEYLEFMNVPDMSCGVYRLVPGASDPQQPHSQDEIYYVINGAGSFRDDDGVRQISPGDILYVPANATHRFEDIMQTLTLLVVFAPGKRQA
ncbi:MAG: dimethylsulfonioproprionate lyase family protein [Proteobacteria bacterium]|jgi:mannose-6-phosphate isomerase-like protein (cupin superfamily)|nr:dimethylsulfonioproprionate lyase family protein [Pseudomonadota bacterium]MDA1299432.1 dimethylsulfonioproprionate lyase family protein [Pseudomonadota bacterium]